MIYHCRCSSSAKRSTPDASLGCLIAGNKSALFTVVKLSSRSRLSGCLFNVALKLGLTAQRRLRNDNHWCMRILPFHKMECAAAQYLRIKAKLYHIAVHHVG
jgi:hypothetical protein